MGTKPVDPKDRPPDPDRRLSEALRGRNPYTEPPPHNGGPQEEGDPPEQPGGKRQLDGGEPEDDTMLPRKRPRVVRAEEQGIRVEHEVRVEHEYAPEEPGEAPLRQPRPRRPRHFEAWLLEDLVDPDGGPGRTSPAAVYALVAKWLASVSQANDKDGRRCRSDGDLHRHYDDDGGDDDGGGGDSRQRARSIMNTSPMVWVVNIVPSTLACTPSSPSPAEVGAASSPPDPGGGAATTSSAGRSENRRGLVDEPFYRDMHLASNNMYLLDPTDPMPGYILDLKHRIRADHASPGVDPVEFLWEGRDLEQIGVCASKSEVEEYFKSLFFPHCLPGSTLKLSNREPMSEHAVPGTRSGLEIVTPAPGILYGYNRLRAFPRQQSQLISMGTGMVAHHLPQALVYPFFVVEFCGDKENLWAATNSCMAGAAACVRMAEQLNRQVPQPGGDEPTINCAAFSLALNGSQARLYLTWKDQALDHYYTTIIQYFLFRDYKFFSEMRTYIRNILDWGSSTRLEEIQDSLGGIVTM